MAGVAAVGAACWPSLHRLLRYSLANDDASHILLIPIICAWLVFLDSKRILRNATYSAALGTPFLLAAWFFYFWSWRLPPGSANSVFALAMVLGLIGGFASVFGGEALRAARFPLLFLFLFVPLPEVFLNKVVYILQKGSADLSEVFFMFTRIPVLRDGFVFQLPRFSIEVARECSGIRSSIALLVLALLAGHFFLRSFWRQVIFVFAGFVVMIVKNGIRIVTLTALANYVDPGFLYGDLHHEGGVVFFLIGLALLWPVMLILRKSEARNAIRTSESEIPASAPS